MLIYIYSYFRELIQLDWMELIELLNKDRIYKHGMSML